MKLLFSIFCLISISTAASAADLHLRPEAHTLGGVVRLGDVAEIVAASDAESQALAQIELLPAPAAGRQRTLSVREVQDTLERRGVNLLAHRFAGAGQVVVAGYAEPVAAQPAAKRQVGVTRLQMEQARRAVADAIVKHLQANVASAEPWAIDNLQLTDDQARAVLADIHSVKATGGREPWLGPQSFQIETTGGEQPAKFLINAQVSLPPAVVVAAKPIPRGSIVRESDLALERTRPEAKRGDDSELFSSLAEVVGREAIRAIAPGQVLDSQYVRSPLLVKRGNVVTVFVRSPGVKLRTNARVREDGSSGDVVTVESLIDRQTFLARVTGIDQVEVYASPNAAE